MAQTKVKLISDGVIVQSNLHASHGITTAHIGEGSNLYYTDARSRAAISVSGNALSYNSSTGVITSNFEESPTFTGNVVINGTLGVGETSPSSYFSPDLVVKASADLGGITIRSNATSHNNYLMFADGTSGNERFRGFINYDHANDKLNLASAASVGLTIDSSQNVGIGTTSPNSYSNQTVLTINGASYGRLDLESGGTLRSSLFSQAANTTLYVGSGFFTIDVGSERLRIDTSGNVLIGSTTFNTGSFSGSATGINVAGVAPLVLLHETDTNKDGYIGISGSTMFVHTADAIPIRFGTSDTERMRITSGGNVGIGTTSPSANLHVQDTSTATLKVITTGVADASVNIQGYDAGVHIGDATNGLRWAIWNDGPSTSSSLKFGSYALGTWYNDAAQVVTMTSGGNVGIGVTDPEKKLEVKSDTTYDGILIDTLSAPEINFRDRGNSDTLVGTGRHALDGFHIDTYSGNAFFIKGSNRYVGIGTTSPSSKLHVENANAAIVYVKSTVNNQNASIWFNSNSGGTQADRWEIGTNISAGTDLEFFDRLNSVSRMVIQNDGNVGIGTISPTAKLEVKGNFKIERSSIAEASEITMEAGEFDIKAHSAYKMRFFTGGSERMRIDTSGNVGIGTTTPYGRLQVQGALTVGPANADPDVTLTETGDDASLGNGGGSIEINMPIQGTTTNGCTLTFTYAAASWKSWILDYEFASTDGMVKGVVGGYNNGSTGHSKTKMLEGFPTSVAVAAVGSGNQHVQVTFTFSSGMGIHPFARFIYSQGGGDGTPRADRVTVAYVEGS